MQDSGRANVSTLGFNCGSSNPGGVGNISDRDLLNYMADMVLELEELAVLKRMEGVADLLGCAHRAIKRNQQ